MKCPVCKKGSATFEDGNKLLLMGSLNLCPKHYRELSESMVDLVRKGKKGGLI